MTVIRPNSISGITSITAQANEINMFRSDGTLAGLQINGINFNNTSGISTLAALNVTGNVSIAGTLTYEDVTNVDSIGIITARTNIYLGDSIFHNGDANTRMRFPAADTISAETAGSERLRITSDGKIGISSTAPNTRLDVIESSASRTWTPGSSVVSMFERNGHCRIAMVAGSSSYSSIEFADTNDDNAGYIRYDHSDNSMSFRTNGTGERLRIDSSGKVGINSASTNAMLEVRASNTNHGITLIDASNSGSSPAFEIISKRSDGNVNTAFSSNIFLGTNRTDQKVANGKFLGTVAFGGNHTDGTEGNISYAAAITARASGDFNSKSDMPTDLIFTTGVSGTDKSGESAGQSNVGTERMRISSTGAVTKPALPYFYVTATPTVGSNNIHSFGNVHGNNGNHYNNSNGRFTAPVSGFYWFACGIWCNSSSTNTSYLIQLQRYNAALGASTAFAGVNHRTQYNSLNCSGGTYMAANDYVWIQQTGISIQASTPRNYFSGYLVG